MGIPSGHWPFQGTLEEEDIICPSFNIHPTLCRPIVTGVLLALSRKNAVSSAPSILKRRSFTRDRNRSQPLLPNLLSGQRPVSWFRETDIFKRSERYVTATMSC